MMCMCAGWMVLLSKRAIESALTMPVMIEAYHSSIRCYEQMGCIVIVKTGIYSAVRIGEDVENDDDVPYC